MVISVEKVMNGVNDGIAKESKGKGRDAEGGKSEEDGGKAGQGAEIWRGKE
jgi:hypothetical protein